MDEARVVENQFIFKEEEFDDAEFDAAVFVARYRRVTSLESLREQLVGYSQHIKRQLYTIINRDYKDFITITTKLDGLDTRAEMMVKPLFSLQMDLSSLQNGIGSSLHAIKDKIDQQQEVVRRKKAIQRILRISANLESAAISQAQPGHAGLSASLSATQASTLSRRNKLYRSGISLQTIEKDLFICSEFERTAFALKVAQQDLEEISKDKHVLDVSAQIIDQLTEKFSEAKSSLLANIKSHLDNYFSVASTTARSAGKSKSSKGESLQRMQIRCFTHCLRALLQLNQTDLARQSLKSSVLEPYLKGAITPGKIDGKAGRGTFSGLQHSLQEYIAWISNSELSLLLTAAEEIAALSPPSSAQSPGADLDLIVLAVWDAAVSTLLEKFPQMVSTGITTVFSSCFRAMDAFARELVILVDASVQPSVRARLEKHPKILRFQENWKLDLYFQLRCRETMQRLDKACEIAVKSPRQDLVATLYYSQETHAAAATASSSSGHHAVPGTAVPVGGSSSNSHLGGIGDVETAPTAVLELKNRYGHTVSLSRDKFEALLKLHQGSLQGHIYDLFKVVQLEMIQCFHPENVLQPLLHKFVGLLLRIQLRLVAHIALVMNVPIRLIGSSDGEFEATRGQYLGVETDKLASFPTPAAEEMVQYLKEIILVQRFLCEFVVQQLAAQLSSISTANSLEAATVLEFVQSSARQVVDISAAGAVHELIQQMWHKVTASLSADCRRSLTAVKAIAGKYRMTNKPAPTGASQYVASIFEPLQTLMTPRVIDQLEVIVSAVAALQQGETPAIAKPNPSDLLRWKLEIAEDVTKHFHEQMSNLLETVKQMDSALQRRARTATASVAGAMTDSDKIYLQAKLDVQEYGASMQKLSINPDVVASYQALWQLVQQHAQHQPSLSVPPTPQT